MNRKEFLAGLSGSSLGLITGCLRGEDPKGESSNEDDTVTSDDQGGEGVPDDGSSEGDDTVTPDELEGTVAPDDDPGSIPRSLQCDSEEFDRLEPWYDSNDVHWGEADVFALRVADTAYENGETIDLTLTHVGNETEEFSDYRHFNFELYTESGWQDVRGATTSEPTRVVLADGDSHEPGEEWHWEIELTESGIEAESDLPEKSRVCPELQSGRYRFVFANQFGAEDNVAVAFDVKV